MKAADSLTGGGQLQYFFYSYFDKLKIMYIFVEINIFLLTIFFSQQNHFEKY